MGVVSIFSSNTACVDHICSHDKKFGSALCSKHFQMTFIFIIEFEYRFPLCQNEELL